MITSGNERFWVAQLETVLLMITCFPYGEQKVDFMFGK